MSRLAKLLPRPTAVVIALFFLCCLEPIGDPDTFLHLATGRLIARGQIPRTDVYSYTIKGHIWRNHEWLAALGSYCCYKAGGYPGVAWVTSVIATSSLLLVLGIYHQLGIKSILARTVALAVATRFIFRAVLARPHIITIFLIGLTMNLLLWHRRKHHIWPLLALPPIFAIWANCHGGFILGALPFLVEGADAIGNIRTAQAGATRRLKELVLAGLGCLLACVLNPAGPELLLFPFKFAQRPRFLQMIMEWQPTTWEGDRIIWTLFIVSLIVIACWPEDLGVSDLAGFLPTLALLFQARRSFFLFAIFGTPLLARSLSLGIARSPRVSVLQNWLDRTFAGPPAAFWLIVVSIASWPQYQRTNFVVKTDFPVAVAEWLKTSKLPREMFNGYNQGGYLVWALRDYYPVFIDGRIDTYQEAGMFEDYEVIEERLPGWDQLLDRYGVNFVVQRSGAQIIETLKANRNWKTAFQQDGYAVMERVNPIAVPRGN